MHTSFWFDGWAGQALSKNKSTRLPSRAILVADAKLCFYRLLPSPLTLHQHEAQKKISQFSPQSGPDRLIWTISPSGTFSVRSIYKILSQGGKIRSTVAAFWKAKVPPSPSMKFFFFLLLNNRLLTHEVKQKRNLPFVPGCALCASGTPETTIHLFFGCPYAMHLWSGLSAILGFSLLHTEETVQQTFQSSKPFNKHRLQQWMVYFISITSGLWRERNQGPSAIPKPHTSSLLCESIRRPIYALNTANIKGALNTTAT